jgi:hypothetical protein
VAQAKGTERRHRAKKFLTDHQSFEADRLEQLSECSCYSWFFFLFLPTSPINPVSSSGAPELHLTKYLSGASDMLNRSQFPWQVSVSKRFFATRRSFQVDLVEVGFYNKKQLYTELLLSKLSAN